MTRLAHQRKPAQKSRFYAIALLALIGCRGPAAGSGSGSASGSSTAPPAPPPTASSSAIAPNARVASFVEAKRHLRALYDEAPHETVYGGCPLTHGRIDWTHCCLRGGDRARLEWEHVVPAARFGGELGSWRSGDARCHSARGKRFKGRRCARVASADFNRMEGDMHNLLPAEGGLNAARGHFPLGDVPGEARAFGSCDFEIGEGRAEPRPAARGELARAYLYMAAAYPAHVTLDDAERRLYAGWHEGDPPDAWEKRRNERIFELQGNRNPYIE